MAVLHAMLEFSNKSSRKSLGEHAIDALEVITVLKVPKCNIRVLSNEENGACLGRASRCAAEAIPGNASPLL
eukprot:8825618-Pyramimonas_sp.AAC.1